MSCSEETTNTIDNNINSELIDLAKELIKKPSVTPEDCGCQKLISEFLSPLGFTIENLPSSEVANLWAVSNNINNNSINSTNNNLIIFAGHTDVVPPGPLEHWDTPPFKPTIKNNILYGRGAADMKGSIAAMLIAVKNFINNRKNSNLPINGRLGFLITSDEEGPAIHGTKYVVDVLKKRNINISHCIIGEPSSNEYLGDIIKNGRRGSLSGNLTLYGKQGHVAYPHKATNAIHLCLDFLKELTETVWDNGNKDFPPTSFQIVDIEAGSGASNIIPGTIKINFNFRYASCSSSDYLTNKIKEILLKYNLKYKISWIYNAEPFLTKKCNFTSIVQQSVEKITQNKCELSTDGGTSDGRFILPVFQCPLIELGPRNNSIHQVNEHVSIDDLYKLAKIYEEILNKLL